MRKLLGCVVLVLGVGGLGWSATTRHAVRMEKSITADTDAVAHNMPHALSVSVSGRDVRVDGVVSRAVDLALVHAAFEGVAGVRVVDVSGVDTLPFADPFELIATKTDAGDMTLSGAVPDARTQAALNALGGASLTVSAGVPDAAWGGVVQTGVESLARLNEGVLTVSGREITLSGRAETPVERAAAMGFMDTLPQGYVADVTISVEDDGTPLRLNVSRAADGTRSASGKLPAEVPIADILGDADLGDADATQLVQATRPAINSDWPDAARTALGALDLLIEGQLEMTETDITLRGAATPAGKSGAEVALLRVMPAFDVITDIALWDDGKPLRLMLNWDGEVARAQGKLPADFTLRGPEDGTVSGDVDIGFLPDTEGAFTRNVTAGVLALGLLDAGDLTVDARTITVTGSTFSGGIEPALDDIFAQIGPDTKIERRIEILDDGAPAAWTLAFEPVDGARLAGRLPDGFEPAQLADALGLDALAGRAGVAQSDSETGTTIETLGVLAEYLPEIERMIYTRDRDGSALNLTMAPGVDLDLVASDLAVRLPADVAFSIAPFSDRPVDGTIRRNSLSGLDEMFRNGFWIPAFDFTADVAGCSAQGDAILARTNINFLSGSARLDAGSIRAINGLAAVAYPCFDAGLRLEIGGHTDATGDPNQNQILSRERADAVRTALVTRGLSPDAMAARGFGQNDPIANNSTPEGRAENRRTSLMWLAQ